MFFTIKVRLVVCYHKRLLFYLINILINLPNFNFLAIISLPKLSLVTSVFQAWSYNFDLSRIQHHLLLVKNLYFFRLLLFCSRLSSNCRWSRIRLSSDIGLVWNILWFGTRISTRRSGVSINEGGLLHTEPSGSCSLVWPAPLCLIILLVRLS